MPQFTCNPWLWFQEAQGRKKEKKRKDQVKRAAEKRGGRKKTGPGSLIPVTIKTPTPVLPIVYIQQPKMCLFFLKQLKQYFLQPSLPTGKARGLSGKAVEFASGMGVTHQCYTFEAAMATEPDVPFLFSCIKLSLPSL